MDKQAFESVARKIEGYKDEIIELQKKLIATPAIGPEGGGDGELEKSELLEPLLREIFDEVEVIKAPDERVSCGYRPNIIAKMNGKSDDKTVWIMAHMDVVPAGDKSAWETPPFEAVVKGGKIYGRGSEDNHQGIVSAFCAAKALKEENIAPSHTMGLLCVADEEFGNSYGISYLLKHRRNLFKPNDLIIVPDAGCPDGSEIEIAEKSVAWLRVKTLGKQSHGAYPSKGINAHRAAAHLVCKMDELYQRYPERDDLFDPPTSTFEPTMKEANVPNINTIPGEDVTCFDCRLLPSADYDGFIKTIEGYFKEIEEKFNVKISYEMPHSSRAPKPTPADSPLVSLLSNAIKDVYKVGPKPVGIGGETVATWLRMEGLHAAVYSRLDSSQHEPNEYCPIEYVIGDAKIWAHVLMQ